MRKILLSLLSTLVVFTAAFADVSKLDLSDFDEEAMRNIDDASKELESAVLNKEVDNTVANAEFIRDSLAWAGGYFAKKRVDDAAQWAQQGRDLAAAIAKSSADKDFTAAYDSFGTLKKTCKSCHDAYKPPSL